MRTPVQTREELVKLALPIVGEDKKDILLDLLAHKTTPNGGVAVTEELKYTSELDSDATGPDAEFGSIVKYSRQNGIHVSPTVLWDGLVANEVSSSWGEKEWSEFLEVKVTA